MSGQTLGAKIRAARKRRAWSQAQLAGKIGVGDWEIGRWEKDQVIPKAEHQSSLQVLLGLRQEDFLVEKRGKRKQRLPTSSVSYPPSLFDFVYPDRFERRLDVVSYTGWREPRWLSSHEEKVHTVVMVNRLNDGKDQSIYTPYVSTPLPLFRLSWFNRASECKVAYDWGNRDEGAKLLAESILAHFFNEPEEIWQVEGRPSRAIMYGLAFRDDVIARLPGWYDLRPTPKNPAEWEITVDEIGVWLSSQIHEAERRVDEIRNQKKRSQT
jgi:transcriptional regulator with XRE-family HTH domain